MSEKTTTVGLTRLNRILAVLKDVLVRLYSLAILLLLCWTGWLAATYLRDSVFRPTAIPANLLAWQGRLDVADLRKQNVPGITGAAGRAPLGHYHGVDRWFQTDSSNTCTTAGCHQPLPHSQKMKVPAFANFHTTFLACQMCHTDVHGSGDAPAQITWISTASGQPQEMPPVLALLRFLDAQRELIARDPAAADKTIEDLLQRTLVGVGADAGLQGVLEQLQSSSPGGPAWRQGVEELIKELPAYARGEYAAKLAPRGARDLSTASAKAMASQAAAYLAAPPGEARDQLKSDLHAPLLKQAVSCLACHQEQSPLFNFEALGYPAERAAALRTLPLAHMMQRIRDGERFFIPEILEAK